MNIQKRQFRIGELAQQLSVEKFVIRFWEKEFNLKPSRSTGGQRFYEETDLITLTHIKELLYTKGFTIAGAKKYINTTKKQNYLPAKSDKNNQINNQKLIENQFIQKLVIIKQQLLKLKEIL